MVGFGRNRRQSSLEAEFENVGEEMRRIGKLLELTASKENIELAVKESLKRRRKTNELQRNAEQFLSNYESNLKMVSDIIMNGTWEIFGYRTFKRVEHGKERIIDWNPSFVDNVIQHALY